jgi:hypothetical protein
MTEEKRIERIESYLDKSLPREEMEALEQKMAESPDLRREVDAHKKAQIVMRYANRKALKERLREIDRETNTQPVKRRFLRQIALAASVLVLIAIGTFMYNRSDMGGNDRLSMSNEELAVEYFSPATTNQMRGSASDPMTFSNRLADADKHFEARDYLEAAKAYESLSAESHPQREKAEWNMALARLAVDDSRYMTDLQDIAQKPTHMFYEQSLELLDVLNSK